MKTSSKVGWAAIGVLSALGIGMALMKDTEAAADAGPTPTVTASSAELELPPGMDPPSSRPTFQITLDPNLMEQTGSNCFLRGRDADGWIFLDYIPIHTIVEVPSGECSGRYEIEYRLWMSEDADTRVLDGYDLVLRYPMELGYGYLLGEAV